MIPQVIYLILQAVALWYLVGFMIEALSRFSDDAILGAGIMLAIWVVNMILLIWGGYFDGLILW